MTFSITCNLLIGSHPHKTIRPFLSGDEKLTRTSLSLKAITLQILNRILFLGLVLLISSAQTGCAPQLAKNGEAQIRERVELVKRKVATIRGLPFVKEIPIRLENNEVIRKYVESELLENNGEEKLRNISLAYAKLGLFPAGMNLEKSLLKMYAAKVQGFYDLNGKEVVLRRNSANTAHSGGAFLGAITCDEKALAHELTHALQDQHFALAERLTPSNNSDKTLAFRAMAEGDANLAESVYYFGGIFQDSSSIAQPSRSRKAKLSQGLSNVPSAIADKLLFEYQNGMSFVKQAFMKAGWPGVNRLYRSPPLSTEQMLHPEKYFDAPDPPTVINDKNLSCLFPAGWKEIENNTLGELMVQSLFSKFLSREEARVVAGGWDGDRFVAFRRGDAISFIWITVWDYPRDAQEFYEKYQQILSKKYGRNIGSNPPYYIEKRARFVIVAEGVRRTDVQRCKDNIWDGIALQEDVAKSAFEPVENQPLDHASK